MSALMMLAAVLCAAIGASLLVLYVVERRDHNIAELFLSLVLVVIGVFGMVATMHKKNDSYTAWKTECEIKGGIVVNLYRDGLCLSPESVVLREIRK